MSIHPPNSNISKQIHCGLLVIERAKGERREREIEGKESRERKRRRTRGNKEVYLSEDIVVEKFAAKRYRRRLSRIVVRERHDKMKNGS